jgi:hypothetical protein
MDYMQRVAERRAKKQQEEKAKLDSKHQWDLSPEKFEQPIGLYAFIKKKKDDDEDEEE